MRSRILQILQLCFCIRVHFATNLPSCCSWRAHKRCACPPNGIPTLMRSLLQPMPKDQVLALRKLGRSGSRKAASLILCGLLLGIIWVTAPPFVHPTGSRRQELPRIPPACTQQSDVSSALHVELASSLARTRSAAAAGRAPSLGVEELGIDEQSSLTEIQC